MLNIQELSNKIKNNPLIIHINPIGLLRMGGDNADRFLNLNLMLNKVRDYGGNIAIPVIYLSKFFKHSLINLSIFFLLSSYFF